MTMNNGIYTIEFHTSAQLVDSGIAVLKDGFINGGNLGSLYFGSYEISGDSMWVKIRVKKHNADHLSVMGPITEFDLNLSGMIKHGLNSFNLTGDSPQVTATTITISGSRRADLAGG